MEEIQDLLQKMNEQRPAQWNALPDISLYMDQVLSLMSRQTIHFEEGDTLTAAMVNNYIKDGVMPRAEGKRYNSEHLGYLTAICVLKQVLPVRDIAMLRQMETSENGGERYNHFCAQLDSALKQAAGDISPDIESEVELAETALRLSLLSYSYGIACRRIVEIIHEKRGDEVADKKRAKHELKPGKHKSKESDKE